ncbi:hypothetical protein I305_05992 [Cryptococcus gattii E566]|uniref:Signal peptidase complex subunit 1 n=1 Tax=Cryptococcus gattii EJB2 TaxID=1296103 RepID=A0ABR5BNX4_9TREE|nr:hypothetical protein I306_05956 [Cryptococcus gattii EJB2]KIY31521.1 hypothetical protein I305_05992 [Cryptococcus gattii E566]KJE02115.1 hypothetical protein I311_04170 [Cryptococcus gattii NT-10]
MASAAVDAGRQLSSLTVSYRQRQQKHLKTPYPNMNHFPPLIQKILEGRIDPQSQQLVASYTQTTFIVLTALAFVFSYLSGSVLLGVESFAAGFTILLIATVPPWPYLKRHPVKFLPVRKLHAL